MRNVEYLVHLVHMNRLSASREFCSGIFGKTADVEIVCHSHLVWLVFEGSIPTCTCFHSENFFVAGFCCFFVCFVVLSFRNSKREERWDLLNFFGFK